jgi:UDP-GlcNAc:undecaprenyl-phosphate/decaprenyl-phosphate GlcNAc-1-phosphate transferase
MHLLVLFSAALLLCTVLTRHVRNSALKRRWACGSIRKRDVHGSPIPRAGGVAICITFLLVVVPYVVAERLTNHDLGFGLYNTFAVLAPACLMFVLGLLDDLRPIPPKIKFAVQVVAGLLLFHGGVRVWFVPLVSGYREVNDVVAVALTVFFVLLISNAFNLIDGLDGLSAGSALFSTLVVFVVSVLSGNVFVSIMTVTLAGAILGFLRYNFNPATIFLGDSGSLFLGFMLSAVALAGAQKGTTVVAVAIPIVSFGLPLLDTGLSVVRRFLSGQPLFRADREHIHHRLMKRGFSHKQAVVMLYGVTAFFGLLSLLLLYPGGKSIGIVLSVIGVGVWLGVQHLGYPELAELGRAARRTVDQRQIIVNNLAIRRAIEELASADDVNTICQVLKAAFAENEFDGFDFSFHAHRARGLQIPAAQKSNRDGAFCYEWRKPGRKPEVKASWQLSLLLKYGLAGEEANFVVYRQQSARNLLFDINMLTGDFQVALGRALGRALEDGEQDSLLTSVAAATAALSGRPASLVGEFSAGD